MTAPAPLDLAAETARLRLLARAVRPLPFQRLVIVEDDAKHMLEIAATNAEVALTGSDAPRDFSRLALTDLAVLAALATSARANGRHLSPTAIAGQMGHLSCDGALARRIRAAGDRLAEPVILRIPLGLESGGRVQPEFSAWVDDSGGGYRLSAPWLPLAKSGWPVFRAADLRHAAGSLPGRRLALWVDLARRGVTPVDVDPVGLEQVVGISSPRPVRRKALWNEALEDLGRLLPGMLLRIGTDSVRLTGALRSERRSRRAFDDHHD